jgi:hypothetical protein
LSIRIRPGWLAVVALPLVISSTGRARGAGAEGTESGADAEHIPGWSNAEAFKEARAALAADAAGDLGLCIAHDRKSLELEEQARTHLHLSSCEARAGRLLDALSDARKALEGGIREHDGAATHTARDKLEALLRRIPHVTFRAPAGIDHLMVTFDDRSVPIDSLTKRFSVDPGEHVVRAEGTQGGVPVYFEDKVTASEGQLTTVPIVMSSPAQYLTPGQLRCMVGAKTQEDVLKCLPQKGRPLVVKMDASLAGYEDTTHVYVWTPGIDATVSSPTQGWNVGGNFLVDVVSAASPDIVSEASARYTEQRYAGGLNGGYRLGRFGGQAQVNYSAEPDYISRGGGLALTADLNDKLITPRVAFNYSFDSIGRGPDNFISTLSTTEAEAGVTFVLSPTSLLLLSATAQFESGDQSKPYRYVPMFDRAIAGFVPVGASTSLVNSIRVAVRPTEHLPTSRERYAAGARFAHRFSKATLRLEQRLYTDSWQLKATTTDIRYVLDLTRQLEVWPHLRFNAQTAANFYKLAYTASVDPNTGQLVVPLFRTTDRELSPLVSLTGGAGAHLYLSPQEAKTQYGVSVQADVMYTKYFDSLYITQRTAVYGSLGFDVEFE